MSHSEPDARLWDARHFGGTVFRAENERPPTPEVTAAGLQIEVEHARALYEELNARHALMLMPGTHMIRMANPFSGVPTGFRVRVGSKKYYANCAVGLVWYSCRAARRREHGCVLLAHPGTADDFKYATEPLTAIALSCIFASRLPTGTTTLFSLERICSSSGRKRIWRNGSALAA